jgi:exodeoxyribonuclease-3
VSFGISKIVCLQETKCVDDAFPREPFEALGYNCHSNRTGRPPPRSLGGDALFLPRTRQKFRVLYHLGLTDAVRAGSDGPGPCTFWDYQAGGWQKNDGIRIDHLLLSPQAADRLIAAGVDKHVRGWEKPSDHVPVWANWTYLVIARGYADKRSPASPLSGKG